MKLKDLFKYATEEESWFVLSTGGSMLLSSSLIIVLGEIDPAYKVIHGGQKQILEHFGKGNIMGILDEEDIVLASSNKELHLNDAALNMRARLLNPLNIQSKAPYESWQRDVLREDFLGRTGFVKVGANGFARGFVEDDVWRPAYKGIDEFDGIVYDVRPVNEMLRDYPEIPKVTMCDLSDADNTPLFLTVGPATVWLMKETCNVSASNQ